MLKHLLNVCLLLVLTLTSGYAEETPLAVYDLTLFGYKLGMTYDEAISARAFHYATFPAENEVIGTINSAYIEDVQLNMTVHFKGDRLFKIIGQFEPKSVEKVTLSLKKAFGAGENNSKEFNLANGTVVAQSLYTWIFPGARINLLSMSNNAEFATIAMIAANPEETEKQP